MSLSNFLRKQMNFRVFRPFSTVEAPKISTNHKTKNKIAGKTRPDLDFDYILNPENVDEIRENIKNRKQIGDIDKLHEIWNRLGLFINNTNSLNFSQAARLKTLWDEFYDQALSIPNKTSPNSPVGDETCSKIMEENLEKTKFQFKPRTAEDLLIAHGTLKTNISVECGEKAYAFLDKGAVLEKSLIDFVCDKLKKENFTFLIVPDVLKVETARNCGLPAETPTRKMLYNLKRFPDYFLSGTAELGIASYYEHEILTLDQLPLKIAAVSRCYRPEIATEVGLYRVHEFTKVEMFAITADETKTESDEMFSYIVQIQKQIFSSLNLHFKVLDMPSQELGAPAFRKIDIEAWMPGRDYYGEISSASNCTDFQSRRLSIRYKDKHDQLKYAHTINGTACATTRLIIALIEQHQKHNSNIETPESLKPFIDKYASSQMKNKPLKMMKTNMKTEFSK